MVHRILGDLTDLLEIKEENIIFDEIFMENEIINGIRCHVFKGYSFNKLDVCPKCGCINENKFIIVKNVRKKLFATTNFANKGCYISNNVSDNIVQNIIDEKIQTPKIYKHSLPKVLCIDEFLQHYVAKLSWNHNQILLDKIKNKEIRKWYVKESVENGWSVSILSHQIASKLYERQALLDTKTTNFDKTLPSPNNEKVKELLKNPYIFDFITLDKDIKELNILDKISILTYTSFFTLHIFCKLIIY